MKNHWFWHSWIVRKASRGLAKAHQWLWYKMWDKGRFPRHRQDS